GHQKICGLKDLQKKGTDHTAPTRSRLILKEIQQRRERSVPFSTRSWRCRRGDNTAAVILCAYRRRPISRNRLRNRLMKSRYSFSAPKIAVLRPASVSSLPGTFIALIFCVSYAGSPANTT